MSKPIFYQCIVLDNQDPLMLGRVRARLVTDNYNDVLKSITNPPWNEEKDKWGKRDPFIFNPLLPYYVYNVPRNGEMIQIIYVSADFRYQNQYYVQNTFFSPTATNFMFNQGANKFTGVGAQIDPPKELINKNDGTYTESGVHKGVFPEANDNAILGRGSADFVLKENELLLRAGKFKGQTLQPNILPVANNQRGFLQLSRFQNTKIPQAPKKFLSLDEITLQVYYLIEWVILNPENQQDKFTGTIYLYQLKPDLSTDSKNLTCDSEVSENLKKLIYSQNFTSLSSDETIKIINDFINVCNSSNEIGGTQLFNNATEKFPIYYRPNKFTYNVLQAGNTTGPEFQNVNKIFNGVKLYAALKQSGCGLIYSQGKVGSPTEIKTTIVEQTTNSNSPTTLGAVGSDKFFLLSHLSAKPGKPPINFNDTLYGISQDVFNNEILPKTSSMVRGEELLELINLIVRFLITHTHAYPGLAPIPVTQDGSNIQEILTQMRNAQNTILNENIRLN